jgi:futalosine hydrolase
LAATPGELAGFEAALEKRSSTEVGGRRIVQGQLAGQPVRLLASGVGMVNTSQALTALIERQRPVWVLQTGCAGAFAQAGLAVGDIGVAEVEVAPYLGIEQQSVERGLPEALPFSIMEKCKNHFPLDENLTARAFNVLRKKYAQSRVNVVKGPFVSVETITATEAIAQRLYDRHGAVMENMEGCAAAQVCLHYGLACVEMRAASNLVGPRQRELWRKDLACDRLTDAAINIMKNVNIPVS